MKTTRLPLITKIAIAIVIGAVCGQYAPSFVVRLANTFNGIFNEFLHLMIPFIILGFVTPAIANIGDKAGKLLVATTLLAYLFTVGSGLFAYLFSTGLFPSIIASCAGDASFKAGASFDPFFSIKMPPVLDVMSAIVISFVIGLGLAVLNTPSLKRGFDEFGTIIEKTITSVVIPLLPIYIFGIFLNMAAVGEVSHSLKSFIGIIVIIFAMTILMLFLQYCLAGAITCRNPFGLMAKMIPAYITALGTSSSAATIPVTLKATKENGVTSDTANFVIPLCATIHISGSTLKITACAIAIMMMNDMPVSFQGMLGFIVMLSFVMVAAPGVPGGAIMAAVSVLHSILGFDATQQAMMITLYIAMDSFGTACNVTGDGAIALIVDKWAKSQNKS